MKNKNGVEGMEGEIEGVLYFLYKEFFFLLCAFPCLVRSLSFVVIILFPPTPNLPVLIFSSQYFFYAHFVDEEFFFRVLSSSVYIALYMNVGEYIFLSAEDEGKNFQALPHIHSALFFPQCIIQLFFCLIYVEFLYTLKSSLVSTLTPL